MIEEPQPRQSGPRQLLKDPSRQALAAGVAAVVLLLAALVFVAVRMGRMDERLAELDERMSETAEIVERAARVSEEAAAQATRAAEDSRLAVEGRQRAETAQAQAEQVAETALEDASNARQEAEAAQRQAEEIRRQRDEELQRLQTSLNRIAETRRTALGLAMNLGSDALQFDFDKSDLRPANRELLSRILGVLLTLGKGYSIYVYGHTDDIGSEQYNLDLSLRRAESVRDYLVEGGVPADIVTTRGFGKSRPLDPSATPAARARNRRVEIGVIQTDIQYEGTVPGQ